MELFINNKSGAPTMNWKKKASFTQYRQRAFL